jgi:hypothetical protein
MAATNLGRNLRGTDGLIGFLERLAIENPRTFAYLLGKLVPLQIRGEVLGAAIQSVTIVPVKEGTFLAPGEIERIQQPQPLQIEATPIEATTSPRPITE